MRILDIYASKSESLRLLLLASLSDVSNVFSSLNFCGDTLSFCKNYPFLLKKISSLNSLQVPSRLVLKSSISNFNCGESAFLSRTFPFLASVSGLACKITGRDSLLQRSQSDLLKTLDACKIPHREDRDTLPIDIAPSTLPDVIMLPELDSSQPISGVLMAAAVNPHPVCVELSRPVSQGYIAMTIAIMREFGVQIFQEDDLRFRIMPGVHGYSSNSVDGDWSAAANFMIAATQLGDLKLCNLRANSLQPDRRIVEIFRECSIPVDQSNHSLMIRPHLSQRYASFHADISHSPDIALALAVLAIGADGVSTIEGVSRLHNKECDRFLAMRELLAALEVPYECEDDRISITGVIPKGGVDIKTFHDHRVAMAASAASLFCEQPLHIDDHECVTKSYPTFWEDMRCLQK